MSKPPPAKLIRLRGVRHNNLKGFDLDLPLGKLIVVTGLSGSGKSSLAFDTLFAEGQRRYIETFSPYARQFFDRMDKPAVDSIEGIPPAIAIEQRNAVRSTRSTVGTMTEICDHLKVLWPHLATLHCRKCGQPVEKEPPQRVWDKLKSAVSSQQSECLVTFDLALSEKLSLKESLDLIAKQGYQRLLVNGEVMRIEDTASHSAFRTPQSVLNVLQDRLKLTAAHRARFIEACEQAYHFGKGRLTVRFVGKGGEGFEEVKGLRVEAAPSGAPSSTLQRFNASTLSFSNKFHCAQCDLDYRAPSPALFSFNNPVGACPACKGFGRTIGIDYGLALPDRSLSLAEGAVRPWRTGTGAESLADMAKFCKKLRVPMDVPFRDLSAEHQSWVIEGDPGYDSTDPANSWPKKWYGVKGYFRWLESKSYKMHVRVLLSRYRSYTQCPACEGRRLQPEALLYKCSVSSVQCSENCRQSEGVPAAPLNTDSLNTEHWLSLADFYALPVARALEAITTLHATHSPVPLDPRRQTLSPLTHALEEVRSRLRFLAEVGLGYLTLDRATRTLSGGETERVNLTTCLGTRLVNTLYALDEPSVGLHPRDTARLVTILQRLRDLGNTVIVVEHEAAVMRAADQIVDLGPGHGETGGELVFQGTPAELLKHPVSLTGQYLSGRQRVGVGERRPVHGEAGEKVRKRVSEQDPSGHSPTFPPAHLLTLSGASAHNLKNLTITLPLARFVCLTGVSGSGKSTLVRDCLLPALQAKLQAAQAVAKSSDRLDTDASSEGDDPGQSAIGNRQSAMLTGAEHLTRVLLVDQSSLGKTPRSNPAVYIGAFDHLRDLFAATDLAKQRGLNSSAFSFNSAVGQCDRCRGAGFEKIEMQFLSDIFIKCPACEGRRYREHVLEVKVRSRRREEAPSSQSAIGHRPSAIKQSLLTVAATQIDWSIADLLSASVDETLIFLAALPESKPAARAAGALRVLQEVGLGYLRLGQPINTLSGGESQRLKLAAHLAEFGVPASAGTAPKPPEGGTPNKTLFIFDEPTTGLHFDDVRVLVAVFQRLVDAGHTVLVIEHNLDVIRAADWLIDLGPEAGDTGGELVIAGTPEQVAACERSHTGAALRGETTQPSTKEAKR